MTKILFIDDNEEFLELCKGLLESYNVEVDTLVGGELAMLKIREFHPDIVFLDYEMPRVGAADVLKEMNKVPETKHIPVILLTGTDENLEECFDLGAKGYLNKSSYFIHQEILKWIDILNLEGHPSS